MSISSFIARFSHQFSTKNTYTFLFILFLITGTALRFYKIDEKSLWYDEFHSIIPTDPSNSFSEVIEYAKGDQPPLFFIALHAWYNIFPYDEFSGKIFCALIGILGVVSMYFLGKEFSGIKVGLAAMFLTATNIFHIYYSQELRFYSLLFLMSSLSFITFTRFVKAPSLKNQAFFILTSVGLLYTHYFGLVVALSQAVLFILIGLIFREGKTYFFRGTVTALLVSFMFYPWIPIIIKDSAVSSFWISDPGPGFFFEYFSRYFNGWWALSFKYILNFLLFSIMLYFIWTAITDPDRKDKNNRLHQIIIFGWAILTLFIPYLYTIMKIPMLVDRYTLITLPAILLIIALGFERIPKNYVKIFIVSIFIVCVIRVYNRYYRKFKKPEYRELSLGIIKKNTNHYPVLSREAWHLNYFFRKYKAGYDVHHLDSLHDEWIKGKQKLWVILPQYHLDSNQTKLLETNFHLEEEINQFEMNASLYVRNDPPGQ